MRQEISMWQTGWTSEHDTAITRPRTHTPNNFQSPAPRTNQIVPSSVLARAQQVSDRTVQTWCQPRMMVPISLVATVFPLLQWSALIWLSVLLPPLLICSAEQVSFPTFNKCRALLCFVLVLTNSLFRKNLEKENPALQDPVIICEIRHWRRNLVSSDHSSIPRFPIGNPNLRFPPKGLGAAWYNPAR